MLTLADILTGLGGAWIDTLADAAARDVVVDSRQVLRGYVFVALQGERVDGHDFVSHAIGRGAIAALVDHDLDRQGLREHQWVDLREPASLAGLAQWDGRPIIFQTADSLAALQQLAAYWRLKVGAASPGLRVIAITGSLGKTSSKELIAQVLSMRYRTLKSEGNFNNEIGLPLTLLKLRPEHERAVLEMGMYARGEIALFAALARPHVGVVTMVAPVHLERLGTIENIQQAKAELVAALPEDGAAILNDDDERVRGMAGLTRARVVTYGITDRAEFWADGIESHGLEGIAFTLHHLGQSWLVRAPLLGRHSVHTALRAVATGVVEGLSVEETIEGLQLPSAQLRLTVVEGPHRSLILDDTYNASEESTLAALNLLAEIDAGPRIAVLGDMLELGDLEEQAHRNVGCRAALVAQHIVCVGWRAAWAAEEAVACGAQPDHVHRCADNAEALEVLRRSVTEKSAILVKGSRGMKMEAIVSGLSTRNAEH